MDINNIFLSVIIPVYNGGSAFVKCLTAIRESSFRDLELIVVIDGLCDQSAGIARSFAAHVLHTESRLGPAAARNLGARAAKGKYLCFIDADCEVANDTLTLIAQTLANDSKIDAVFGSYDEAPSAANFTSQYKNLFHRHIHQTSKIDASTFWTGCGALKRSLFLALGGFDETRYAHPCIEDIELGYRIKQSGGNIVLAKNIQVKHHKVWTFWDLVRSDIVDRGIPWTELILNNRNYLINDLNLKTSSRLSVFASYILMTAALSIIFSAGSMWANLTSSLITPSNLLTIRTITSIMLASMAFLFIANWQVHLFFLRRRGLIFALGVIPMQWIYYLCCGLAAVGGTLSHFLDRRRVISAVKT